MAKTNIRLIMNSRQKVLLIVPLTTTDWGTKNAGGVDTVCQMTIEGITNQKEPTFYYRILAFDPLGNHVYTRRKIQLAPHVELVWLSNKKALCGKFTPPSLVYMLYNIYRQINEFKPNIIHSHIWSWLIGLSKKRHRIVTVHSYKSIGRRSVSRLNNWFYVSFIPNIMHLFSDEIICVGSQLQLAVQFDVNKKVKLIGNPIDNKYFIKHHRSINTTKATLVTCALLAPKKQIEKAITLTKALNDNGGHYVLNIIGPASDNEYFSILKKHVVDLNLEDKVNFLGALNKLAIIEQYKRSDLGVFFSKEETFGLAPLEMLATGLPLLSTEVGVLAEKKYFFETLGVKFIDVNETNEHLTKAKQLLEHPPSINIDVLKKEFSVSSVNKQYEELYKAIIFQ